LTRASRSCSWALYHSHKWRHSRTYMTSTTRRHYSITLSLPRCGHILRLPLRNPTAIVRSRRFSSRPISSCLNRYRKRIFLCLWNSSTLSSRHYLKRSRHTAFPRLSRPSSLHSTKFNNLNDKGNFGKKHGRGRLVGCDLHSGGRGEGRGGHNGGGQDGGEPNHSTGRTGATTPGLKPPQLM